MPKQQILLVEDDPIQQRTLRRILERDLHVEVLLAENGLEAWEILRDPVKQAKVALALVDLTMPVMDGKELLRENKKLKKQTPFIVLTASERTADVVEVMKLGAIDFICKPIQVGRLLASVQNALALASLQKEVCRLQQIRPPLYDFDAILEICPNLREIVELARKGARSRIPILLTGESGVGKEVFAHSIYQESDRAGEPFVTINCGAIPDNLVESTLFGHEKGAFTGAFNSSTGKCREADGGVLFLDEVGELKPDVQVKLLRMLQEGEIEPVGGNRSVKVDLRIISATNRPLESLVEQGKFRQDLYYRLQGLPVHIPPLRKRKRDVLKLACHLLTQLAQAEEQPDTAFSPCALQWLQQYSWPGNVRELKHILHRAVLLVEGGVIRAVDMARWISPKQTGASALHSRPAPFSYSPSSNQALTLFHANGHAKSLSEIEEEVVNLMLTHYNMHIGRTAAALGIGQSTLYKKLKRRHG